MDRGVTFVIPMICATHFLFEPGPGFPLVTDFGPVKMRRKVYRNV
jgi:hypothetical protein